MLKKILSVIGIVVVFIVVFIVKGTRKVVTHTISEVAGQAIGNVAGKAISNTVYPPSKPTIQSLENELARTADSINKTLPMKIDKETRLDKVEINSGLRLTFFHTLLNYSSREIDINSQIQTYVKNNVCANEERKSYLQHGVTFDYIYSGNDGVEINRFEINKDDCKNSANVATIEPPTVSTAPTANVPQAVIEGCIGDCTNGQGTFTFANGGKYIGEFKNGKVDGQGTLTYADGGKYAGMWSNGIKEGQGTLTLADGGKYVGRFKNDTANGQGTFIYSNGDKYIGKFKNGVRNGRGDYFAANGTIIKGIWKNGQPPNYSTQQSPTTTRQATKARERAEAQAREQAEIQAQDQAQVHEQAEAQEQTQTREQPEANSKPLSLRERAEADSRAFSLRQQESDKRQSAELQAWREAQTR
ncbi:hypothetical protein BCS42_14215 [Crenothrix sp. D3]|nr:hypothetical protein BCS42_14215 [Crenothrix sp. D3]